jgi:hypothetical protein
MIRLFFYLAFLLCLLYVANVCWVFFSSLSAPQQHPFDPTREIRIEFPRFGGGLSQGESPIIHEVWSGPTGFSYEITNNVLEHEKRHYLLQTGNIVRFELGGVISIDGKPAVSLESVLVSTNLAIY